jgi:hypothetical protein
VYDAGERLTFQPPMRDRSFSSFSSCVSVMCDSVVIVCDYGGTLTQISLPVSSGRFV